MVKRVSGEPATDLLSSVFELAEFYADSILRQADLQTATRHSSHKKKAGGDLPQSPP